MQNRLQLFHCNPTGYSRVPFSLGTCRWWRFSFPQCMQKHSQNRVQNPVKTQSSGRLGKRTISGNATTILVVLQTLDTALVQEASGFCFCFVLAGFFFFNPLSKLTTSLCNKSVVILDSHSNFQFIESITGPIKVILMLASGFYKAEGTAKFQKTSASTQTCWRGHKGQHKQGVLTMIPLEKHPLLIL